MTGKSIKPTKNRLFIALFMISYTAILGYSIFGHIDSFEMVLKNISTIGYLILLLLTILQIKYFSSRDVIIALPLLIISAIIALNAGNYSFMKLLLIIASVRTLNIRQCIKVDIIIRFIFLPIMLILFYAGIAQDNPSVVGDLVRHSMGFSNCNQFGMFIFIAITEIIYLNKAKFSIKTLLIIAILLLFEENTSGCRTVFVSTIILLLLTLAYRLKAKILENKLFKNIAIILPIIFIVTTLVAAYYYEIGNELAIQINSVMSGRLQIINSYLDKYPITLLGNNLAATKVTLDNLYAYSIIALGIVPTIIITALYVKLLKKLYKEKEYILIIILITFMIYGLSERLWLYPEYNALIIIIKEYVFENKLKNIDYEK